MSQDEKRFNGHTHSVATPALLGILLFWSGLRNSVSADLPGRVLTSIVREVGGCAATVHVTSDGRRVGVLFDQGCATFEERCSPITDGGLQVLVYDCLKQLLNHGLQAECRRFIDTVASVVEEGVRTQLFPRDALAVLPELCRRRKRGAPVDPDLIERIQSLPGDSSAKARSVAAIGRAAKALRLSIPTPCASAEAQRSRRYLFACRRTYDGSASISMAVDAKRFGGKHWLAGAMYCGDSGRAAWCPPVAPRPVAIRRLGREGSAVRLSGGFRTFLGHLQKALTRVWGANSEPSENAAPHRILRLNRPIGRIRPSLRRRFSCRALRTLASDV